MSDIAAVMWKESREILDPRSTKGRDLLVGVLFVGIFGVFSPWVHGEAWVRMPLMVFAYAFLAGAAAAAPTLEAFAGERERHTLETLLATPLSDRSILLGKYFTAVLFGWALVPIIMVVGLAAVNLLHGDGAWIVYRPAFALWTLLLPLLAAGIYAAVGIFISLRAATLRQASQTLGMSIVVILIAPFIVLVMLPDAWAAAFLSFVTGLGTDRQMLGLAVVMLTLNVALMVAAMRRFRRGRLILE